MSALVERHHDIDADPTVLYIDDGQILTSAGTMAGMDLCIHLIRKDLGSQAANAAARNLVAPPHRAGGQAQYPDSPVPHARTMPALPRPSSGRCGTSINR